MPQIKIDYIVSFSSEHSDHPANNLLSKEISNKHWTCLNKGESSASVVFQLEKSVQISSLSIGNFHSALVEVLVARSETPNQPFEVLLCASSFMNPNDSRNSLNTTNIRTFSADQLVKSVQSKKWDRIRVVCTQPYNKHVQYGLSFIHFFNSDSVPNDEQKSESSASKMLGRFKVKPESEEDSRTLFKPGEMFAKQKQNLSTDSQIRLAGSSDNLNTSSTLLVKGNRPIVPTSSKLFKDTSAETLSRKRDKLMYIDDDDEQHEKIDKVIETDRMEKAKKKENQPDAVKVDRKTVTSVSQETDRMEKGKKKENRPNIDKTPTASTSHNTVTTNDRIKDASKMKQIQDPPKDVNERKRTLSTANDEDAKKKRLDPDLLNVKRGADCLRGVVFVISGYVNPQRSILRDTAVSLGARYCPDWNGSCTHLICAFSNTPKHEQVKRSSNKGIVVTGDWITECGKEKAHVPWKWYATDPRERVKRTSSDVLPTTSRDVVGQTNASKNTSVGQNDDDLTDIDGGDTDDDIERILEQQLKANENDSRKERLKNNLKKLQMSDDEDFEMNDDDAIGSPSLITTVQDGSDPYSVDTDPDEFSKENGSNANNFNGDDLSDFFSGIKFYVDPKLEDTMVVQKLKRYIKAYKGELVEAWPDKHVDVAVTLPSIVDELKQSKEKQCALLTPEWVWKCHNTKSLYEYKEFEIR